MELLLPGYLMSDTTGGKIGIAGVSTRDLAQTETETGRSGNI
jgi:hypothetical protein